MGIVSLWESQVLRLDETGGEFVSVGASACL